MATREHEGRALVDRRSEGGRCELCHRLGSNVHHRMKQGRPWFGSNLLRLCGSGTTGCHGWIEAHPEHAMALGLWVPRGTADVHLVPMYCWPILFHLGWWYADDEGMWTQAPEPELTLERRAAIAALQEHLASAARCCCTVSVPCRNLGTTTSKGDSDGDVHQRARPAH